MMSERNLAKEIQAGLIEIRDHPEKLKRTERIMIEISEKREGGHHNVYENDGVGKQYLGDIVKTTTKMWLAIPRVRNVSNPLTAHKLRRDAIAAL